MTPIVGIGELLWDVYPDGRKVAGGAPFNFAFHCQQLGHETVIVSRVGDDDLGRELREEVRRLGMTDEFIQTDPNHPTGTVRVSVDAGGQPTYTIAEDVAWDYITWDEHLKRLAASATAVCFGTLAQRQSVSRDAIRRLVDPTTSALRVCDLNFRWPFVTSDVVKASLASANWVKLNHDELALVPELVDWRIAASSPDERTAETIDRLKSDFPLKLICVTRGGHGCKIVSEWGDVDLPGVPVNLVDTVGAGDAFTAALLVLQLERARPLSEVARSALHYAGRVCEFRGGTPRIDRADVERAAFGRLS
ncbi:carbohydrate kinase family protein [Fimbriiglobus ruber]|uniref:Fructokinase n=1 Tax=Fimbriiglobus ruber TaxID=1908690 RepID=A0A225D896_9BACT|nr:carbohydrate kinase [Fimbriiglobus ruber]OWK37682.1 Fructokinase [Fimbriiglobus ruber]